MQVGVGLAGLACALAGSPWAYFHEYLPGEVVIVFAQCLLLYGVWSSFYPQISAPRIQLAAAALIFLLALYSALDFSALISPSAAKDIVLFAHVSGYTFCILIFAMTMAAWFKGCAWHPAAARCMIAYAITTAATFGIEQSEAVIGYRYRILYHAPQVFYLVALLIWNSAVSLDKTKNFTPEEMARLEAALAESLGRVLPPQRSAQI